MKTTTYRRPAIFLFGGILALLILIVSGLRILSFVKDESDEFVRTTPATTPSSEKNPSAPKVNIWQPRQFASLDDLYDCPEDQIGIAEAILLIQKELWPFRDEFDTDVLLGLLDEWAQTILETEEFVEAPPRQKIKIINNVLFKNVKLKCSAQIRVFSQTIKERKGQCDTLSFVYLAVCQRLRLPVKIVRLPKHLFLRWEDADGTYINIDPTANGYSIADKWYIDTYKITLKDLEEDIMIMRSVSNKRTIAYYLSDLAYDAIHIPLSKVGEERKRFLMSRGADSMRVAIRLAPTWAEAYGTLGCFMREYADFLHYCNKQMEIVQQNRDRIRANPPPNIPPAKE